MNGVSPVFRFSAICYKGNRRGEAVNATAEGGDVRTLPITYIRFGMISYTSALPTSSI